jgi:hypothetical protein
MVQPSGRRHDSPQAENRRSTGIEENIMRNLAKAVGAVFAAAAFAVSLAPAAGAATTDGATSTARDAATGYVWCGDHWERARANGDDCGTGSPGGGDQGPRSGYVWCGDHWERVRANGDDCGTGSPGGHGDDDHGNHGHDDHGNRW